MKKLQDLFYNINDILLALLIIFIASLIILWRMDVILDYPQQIVTVKTESKTSKSNDKAIKLDVLQPKENETVKPDNGQKNEAKPNAKDNTANKASNSKGIENPSNNQADLWTSENTLKKNVSLTIPALNNANGIADVLINAGIVKSYDKLEELVKAQGKSMTDFLAGSYTFSSGTNINQIIKSITR